MLLLFRSFYVLQNACTQWINSSYEVVPLVDVLESKIPARAFDDCIVMVGAYASGMMDDYNVAIHKDTKMYGVEIHANILEALMEGKTAVEMSNVVYTIIIAMFVVGFYLINRKMKPVYGAN